MHPFLRRQLDSLALGDEPPSMDAWLKLRQQIDETYEAHDFLARSKSEFLANMSHEIRTPLNGVIGMIELVLGTPLSQEQVEYARAVRLSAEALLTVLNDILDFSKLEAGKMEIEQIDFDLRALIEEVGDIVGAKAREKELELVVSLDANVPRYVSGDPARLRQVLLNLTSNAIKFTHRGEVIVRGSVDTASTGAGVGVTLSVSDTGIGIPPDRISKLFQPFTQMDPSTTRRFGGTGLGLAISKELVHRMNGTLIVESKEHVGSAFLIKMRFEHGSRGEVEPTPDIRFYGARALVVDDNSTNRMILVQLLEGWGLETITAASGAEALEIVDSSVEADRQIDVVVSDFQMPGMNGHQFAKLLKSDARFRDVPMILGTSSPELRAKLEPRLFSMVLPKPIKQSQLHRALCVALKRGTLPWKDESHARDVPSLPAGVRVLLVEDNVVNQKVAQRLLERAGAVVDVAGDGLEAVTLCRRRQYDLVLMDCQMPTMDGYKATSQIRREQGNGSRVPIIALTANASEADRQRCAAADMDGYLSKPVRAKELCAAIISHLGAA